MYTAYGSRLKISDSKCGFGRDREKSLKCGSRVPYRAENAVRLTQKPFRCGRFVADRPHFESLDKSTFSLVSSSQGNFSITCIFQTVEGGFTWTFTGVYGPQARVDKLRFWEELRNTKVRRPGPWCVGGRLQ